MNTDAQTGQYPYHTDVPTGGQSKELLDWQAKLVRANLRSKELIEKYRRGLAADPPEPNHEKWYPIYRQEIEDHERWIGERHLELVEIQERLLDT